MDWNRGCADRSLLYDTINSPLRLFLRAVFYCLLWRRDTNLHAEIRIMSSWIIMSSNYWAIVDLLIIIHWILWHCVSLHHYLPLVSGPLGHVRLDNLSRLIPVSCHNNVFYSLITDRHEESGSSSITIQHLPLHYIVTFNAEQECISVQPAQLVIPVSPWK